MSKSLAQKKMSKVIDVMFEGMDDEYLKTVMKVLYCGEDEAVLDEMAKQHEKDLEAIKAQMELENIYEVVVKPVEEEAEKEDVVMYVVEERKENEPTGIKSESVDV